MTTPNTKAFILTGLAAGLLTSAPLGAEDGSSKLRFGIEGSFALPADRASEIASNGFGVGMNLVGWDEEVHEKWWKSYSSFGLSINYVRLGEKKWDYAEPGQSPATSIENVNILLCLWDWFRHNDTGFFYSTGLGLGYSNILTNAGPANDGLALNAVYGVGYDFNKHIGLVAKYTFIMRGPSFFNWEDTILYGQVGAQYRF
jgi:hypothetical protein